MRTMKSLLVIRRKRHKQKQAYLEKTDWKIDLEYKVDKTETR